jgi:hypothetical protein
MLSFAVGSADYQRELPRLLEPLLLLPPRDLKQSEQ